MTLKCSNVEKLTLVATISSASSTLPGNHNRSSINFSLNISEDKDVLVCVDPGNNDKLHFDIYEDKVHGKDHRRHEAVSSGRVAKWKPISEAYIGNPRNATTSFTVNFYQ